MNSTEEEIDELVIDAAPAKGIPVRLVGKRYIARKPKGMLALRMGKTAKDLRDDGENAQAAEKLMLDYVRMTFSSKDAKAIEKRLDDPDDDLDLEQIGALIKALAERTQAANPTT